MISVCILFDVVSFNRLKDTIHNISFYLTFGNQDGEYIFEETEIELTEDVKGILEKNSAVPFFMDITEDDEELFYSMDNESVYIQMDDFTIDFVE